MKWPEIPSKVNFGHPKWPINLKWSEMRSKVIFRHPKWPPKKIILYQIARIAFESEFRKSKMADRYEMARNAIESEFWTSDRRTRDCPKADRRPGFCRPIGRVRRSSGILGPAGPSQHVESQFEPDHTRTSGETAG